MEFSVNTNLHVHCDIRLLIFLLFILFIRTLTETGSDSGWTKHRMVKSCSFLSPWTLSALKDSTKLVWRSMERKYITGSRWRNMVNYGWFLLSSLFNENETQNANNHFLFSPVLPKFEVNLNSPVEVSMAQEEVQVEVCAKLVKDFALILLNGLKLVCECAWRSPFNIFGVHLIRYTYGQPVPGSVIIEACRPLERYFFNMPMVTPDNPFGVPFLAAPCDMQSEPVQSPLSPHMGSYSMCLFCKMYNNVMHYTE